MDARAQGLRGTRSRLLHSWHPRHFGVDGSTMIIAFRILSLLAVSAICHRATTAIRPARTHDTSSIAHPTDAPVARAAPPLAQIRDEHGPKWPIPPSATRISAQMWALTIQPSRSGIRPQRHSSNLLSYRKTAYKKDGSAMGPPSAGLAALEYFKPPWQTLFLSMSAGEVKRVWVVNPGEPVLIFDVKLRSVIGVR